MASRYPKIPKFNFPVFFGIFSTPDRPPRRLIYYAHCLAAAAGSWESRSEWGVPERVIESLGVMGWGVGWSWKILPPPSPPPSSPPKVGVLGGNGFFTIGPQNRDRGALLPGNDSYGRPASFLFSWEMWEHWGKLYFLNILSHNNIIVFQMNLQQTNHKYINKHINQT